MQQNTWQLKRDRKCQLQKVTQSKGHFRGSKINIQRVIVTEVAHVGFHYDTLKHLSVLSTKLQWCNILY